jgi:twinkle protein
VEADEFTVTLPTPSEPQEPDEDLIALNKGVRRNLPDRGLSLATLDKYSIKVTPDNSHQYYPYYNQMGDHTFLKVREVAGKRFFTHGSPSNLLLFGQQVFPIGGKRITICEGELDACSVYEMHQHQQPVVSVRSSASATKDCSINYAYLDSFEEIFIAFDNDAPGRKAAQGVAQLFDSSKIRMVEMVLNDPSEYLVAGKVEEFRKLWWDASTYTPDGIVSSVADFWDIAKTDIVRSTVNYPWTKLNKLTYGIRRGEAVLVTAPEGVGKTQIMREIGYKILTDQKEDSLGLIFLEENKERTVKGLMSLAANKPLHLPDSEYTDQEFKEAFDNTFGTGRVHMFSNFDHNSFNGIASRIRFMARALDCKYFILDHISILVSDQDGIGDERRTLDSISTKLRFLCQELDIALVLVSHLNDAGQTRGSRNISKVADIWINLERDLLSEDERMRNTTHLTIKKNRFSGFTGGAGSVYFDASVCRLVDVTFEEATPPAVVFEPVTFEEEIE